MTLESLKANLTVVVWRLCLLSIVALSASPLDTHAAKWGEGTWGEMKWGEDDSSSGDTPTAFVERFYTNILGRPSDEAGLNAWLDVIQTQSASAVAQGFLNSAEFKNKNLDDAAFVDTLYRTLFDRAGDEGGTNYWLGQLAAGKLRDMVVWGFLRAAEFKTLSDSFGVIALTAADESTYGVRAFTERFYTVVLGRHPDQAGFDGWVSGLSAQALTGGDLAKAFFLSAEYVAQETSDSDFVETAYQAFFGRAADAAGKQGWLDVLSIGGSREYVLDGFIGSAEFAVLAASYGISASRACSQSPSVAGSAVSISDAEVIEGDEGTTDITFNVSLSRAASSDVCVEYRTSDNTASAGEDYLAARGTLTFAAGETSKSITVSVIGDNLYADEDGDESFTVSLASSSATVADGDAVGAITNDDMTIEESLDDLKAILRPFYIDLREQGRHLREFPIDLGGDGDEDLMVQVHSIVENEVLDWLVEAYPLSYFVNNKGNGFERVDTDIDMHSSLWETADVNGDGLDDLISVAGHQIHEVDGQIYREDYVRLLVQTENGELIDSSDSVDERYADWHGLTVLDIELDGDIDFVAGGLHDSVYAFINDGFGNFSITQNNLPIAELDTFMATGGWPTPSDQSLFFTTIHAVDLNNDGYKEILLGGANSPNHYLLTTPLMPILRNERGTFTFDYVTDTLDVLIPDVEGPSVPAVLAMKDIDINNDGCTDLLLHNTDYQENSAVTTYQSDCNGSLSEVFHYQFSEAGWVEKFYIADVTGDGLKDFYGVRNISGGEVDLFTNNGDDTYTHSDLFEFTYPNFDLATYIRLKLWR